MAKRKKDNPTSYFNSGRVAFAIFMVLAFILYGNTLGHEYVLDDDIVVVKNNYVQNGIQGLPDIFSNGFISGFNEDNDQTYRPLVLASFAFENQFFGNNPRVGHFFNIVLYGLSGFLVWLFTKQVFPRVHSSIFWIIPILFLTHPVHTEVVANIKSRDELLHFLFFLGALLSLMKYVRVANIQWLLVSAMSYLAALLSKEMAVTMVAVVPMMLWLMSNFDWKKIASITGLYAGLVCIYLLVRNAILDGSSNEELQVVNNALVAAPDALTKVSSAIFMGLLYIKLLIFPYNLTWDYSFNEIPLVGISDWQSWVALLVLLGLLMLGLIGLKRKAIWSFGILFFFITMSVVSNLFVMIGATMGERFLFTPSLGFVLIVPIGLSVLLKEDLGASRNSLPQKVVFPLAFVSLVFLVKTVKQNKVWESSQTLYEHGVEASPNSTRAWSALGTSYRIKAERSINPNERFNFLKRAFSAYQQSIKILDDNFDSWYNLGVTLNLMGDSKRAVQAFEKSVEIEPKFANGWNNMGVYYFNTGNADKATAYFEKAYELNPNSGSIVGNMGLIPFNKGDYKEAIKWFTRAIELDPSDKNMAKNLSVSHARIGNLEQAQYYQQLVSSE